MFTSSKHFCFGHLSATYLRFDRWSENETHGALLGAVANDEVDFGVAFFLITFERLEYIWSIMRGAEHR